MWLIDQGLGDQAGEIGFSLADEFFADHLDDEVAYREDSPGSFEFDVFVSRSFRDLRVAVPLVAELRLLDVRVWFDVPKEDPDESRFILYRFLHSAIRRSQVGVAVVNESFLTGRWAPHEFRGLHRHGLLRAVVLDGVDQATAFARLEVDAAPLVLDATALPVGELAAEVVRGIGWERSASSSRG